MNIKIQYCYHKIAHLFWLALTYVPCILRVRNYVWEQEASHDGWLCGYKYGLK